MQPHPQALQEYPEQQAPYKEIHDLLDAPRPRYMGFPPEELKNRWLGSRLHLEVAERDAVEEWEVKSRVKTTA